MLGRMASPFKAAAWAALAAFLVAAPVLSQPVLTPELPTCVPAEGNAPISLRVTSDNGWTSVRTYFREAGKTDFYYTEMRASGQGSFWTVLPIPEAGTTAVEIQTAVVDARGIETRSPITSVPVTTGCAVTLTAEQKSLAESLVVGETSADQKYREVLGFQCSGIIARVDYNNEFRVDEQCRRVVMGAKWIVPLAILGTIGGGYVYLSPECEEECSPCRPCETSAP